MLPSLLPPTSSPSANSPGLSRCLYRFRPQGKTSKQSPHSIHPTFLPCLLLSERLLLWVRSFLGGRYLSSLPSEAMISFPGWGHRETRITPTHSSSPPPAFPAAGRTQKAGAQRHPLRQPQRPLPPPSRSPRGKKKTPAPGSDPARSVGESFVITRRETRRPGAGPGCAPPSPSPSQIRGREREPAGGRGEHPAPRHAATPPFPFSGLCAQPAVPPFPPVGLRGAAVSRGSAARSAPRRAGPGLPPQRASEGRALPCLLAAFLFNSQFAFN